MPEADTIGRVKSRRLQVASLPPADSGRGFARLPEGLMHDLGLAEGDVIEITGKRSTAARAIRPYGEDEGIDIIRIDGLQRANAGVGSGDFVDVRKAESKPATRVVFAPAQPNVRLQGSAEALKRTFAGRPVVEGDTVSTTGHQRINADMPDHIRQLLNAPAFALQELRLVVVTALPKGIVHIDASTVVETTSPSTRGRPAKVRFSASAEPCRRTLGWAGAKTTRVAGLDSALRTSTKSPEPTPALARWSPSRRIMSMPSSSP